MSRWLTRLCKGSDVTFSNSIKDLILNKKSVDYISKHGVKAVPAYLRSSFGVLSGPFAFPFFNALAAISSSIGVIGTSKDFGGLTTVLKVVHHQ